jgi:peptide deformylase
MPLLDILQPPHPTLKRPATPVDRVDDDLLRLMDDMLATMYEAPGIGLAAPQVDVGKRLVVIDTSEEKDQPIRLINPSLTWRSDETDVAEEGCLSLPGQFAEVKRPVAVKVRYLDERESEREIDAEGLLARCLQHEIDHLDGILFVDHLSALKRNMIMRRLAKQRRVKA